MALVIEDGSQVAGATSYITVSEYSTWADNRFGAARTTKPTTALAYESIILRAMDYFETLVFKGYLVSETQALQWPRQAVVIDGFTVATSEIPKEVEAALYELTYAEELGNGELNSIDRKVEEQTVGPIKVKYASNSASRTINPAINRALQKLTKVGGAGGSNFAVTRR